MVRRTFGNVGITTESFESVKDWGARGDGSTDDTAAFNTAISKLAATGGIVLVNDGDHIVASPAGLTTGGRELFWLLSGTVNGVFNPALPGTIINSGASTFESLTDTPAYAGNALLFLRLNAGETALEFAAGAAGIANIVEDLSPQLGGNLDLNSFVITGLDIGTDVQAQSDILDDLAGLTQATDKVLYFDSATTAAVLDFLDEDAMGSDSATALASQQSIKAYVDTQVATVAGIARGTVDTTTGGTSVDFTGLAAGLNRITVHLSGVSLSGTSRMIVQLGDAGGVETTGYVSGASNGGTGTSSTAGLLIHENTGASNAWTGSVTLVRHTGNAWVISGTMTRASGSVALCAGSKTLTAELDRIRLTTTNGTDTFDAMSVNIFTE